MCWREERVLTLPARKEGIIPGAANMRLPRFTATASRGQAIQYEKRLECDSPEGRLICDEIVETARWTQPSSGNGNRPARGR